MLTVLATLDGQPIFLAQPAVTSEQSDAEPKKDGETKDTPSSPFGGWMFPVILGMMIIWIFMLGSGSRKQKKKQQELLASMSKGSKIVTIGGIKGSVVEVREDEVIVKVDENSNTRLKFSRDAIRSVIDDASGKDVSKEQDKDKPEPAGK